MSSGAELLRKTLTGSHQKTQHRSRQRNSRVIARQDKKVYLSNLLIFIYSLHV